MIFVNSTHKYIRLREIIYVPVRPARDASETFTHLLLVNAHPPWP